MSWKNWPYWLKGGVIGLAFIILLEIINLLLSFLVIHLPFINAFENIDIFSLILCRGFCSGENRMVQLITIWPSYFIIGAIIGWIIGKIKQK